MKIVKNKENKILIEDERASYILIDESGQIQLKDVYKFLNENIKNKDEIIKKLEIDESIAPDLGKGLKIFVTEILNNGSTEESISDDGKIK